jgi:hypothetical protein
MKARLRLKRVLVAVSAFVLSGTFTLAARGQHLMTGQICEQPSGPAAGSEKSQVDCKIDKLKRGDRVVFVNGGDRAAYRIDGGKKAKPFAGMNVVVIGSIDERAGTIDISDIFQTLSPVAMKAKTIYIDCDACPRGMSAAWRAAFEALSDWGRFDILPEPMGADLILIVSANPYLGDYLTRDGPDRRPVFLKTTYMDLVDPHTGQSLWGDSKVLGSWLIPRSTKDLVGELKDRFKLEESVPKS